MKKIYMILFFSIFCLFLVSEVNAYECQLRDYNPRELAYVCEGIDCDTIIERRFDDNNCVNDFYRLLRIESNDYDYCFIRLIEDRNLCGGERECSINAECWFKYDNRYSCVDGVCRFRLDLDRPEDEEEDEPECRVDRDCPRGQSCIRGDCSRHECEGDLVWNEQQKRCIFPDGDCVTNNDCDRGEWCNAVTHICEDERLRNAVIVSSGELCNINPDMNNRPVLCEDGLNCVDTVDLFEECRYENIPRAGQMGVCYKDCLLGYKLPQQSCSIVECKGLLEGDGNNDQNLLNQCKDSCRGAWSLFRFLSKSAENECIDTCYEQYGSGTQQFFHSLGDNLGWMLLIIGVVLLIAFVPGLLALVMTPVGLIIIGVIIIYYIIQGGLI